jgi:hypothetical protein
MPLASFFVSMMSWLRPRSRQLGHRVACLQEWAAWAAWAVWVEWVECPVWAACRQGCSKATSPEFPFYLIYLNFIVFSESDNDILFSIF